MAGHCQSSAPKLWSRSLGLTLNSGSPSTRPVGFGPPGEGSREHCRHTGRGPARDGTPPGSWSVAGVHRGGRRVLSRGQACLGLRWERVGAGGVEEVCPLEGAQAGQEEPAGRREPVGTRGPSCHSISGERAGWCEECSSPNLVFRKREGGGGREGLMRQGCLPADAGTGAGTSPRAP